MLSGLMSRCTIPRWAAYPRALPASESSRRISGGVSFLREAEHRGERAAAQELHDEVDHPPGAADPVDGDDVRVFELGRGAGFALESLHELGVEGQGKRQHLYRHFPLELPVLGPIDHGHAAPAQLLDDLVLRRQRLAHQIELLQHPGRDGMDRRGRHQIETAGGAELRFSGDFAATAGAEHGVKLRQHPR